MSDPVSRPRLLPQNATPRELAIQDADARVEDLDVGQIIAARDPERAPLPILPYLAWERSVDVWSPDWPESTKRAVVIAAPEVHRHKGTRYAVSTALAALGIDNEIVEWWQTTPKGVPYTFDILIYARGRKFDGPVLDPPLIRTAFQSVLRAKPASRAFAMKIAASTTTTVGVAGAFVPKTKARAAVTLSATL